MPPHERSASDEPAVVPIAEQETETYAPASASLSGWLPSRPAETPVARPAAADPLALGPGDRIAEFVVERTLGRGGFGVVYLARQLSLDRLVALKVAPLSHGAATDGEGRAIARLEHDNIVQVYAEIAEPVTRTRLLCMQYVAGTTLATVARELRSDRPGDWTGADLLAVLDRLGLPPALFDPAAMRDRDLLAESDHVEAVCRIGGQLARALEHAHVRGVLHRDVKPANVLVSRYGRPLLADFNLATGGGAEAAFGGTLAYMAPEHLDAFDPDSSTPPEVVDARSDVYSLCVVLWELSTGGPPFAVPDGRVERSDLSSVLRRLAADRRTQPPQNPPRDRRLARVLARGLAADPAERYASAAELAEALSGLREQRAAIKAFPPADPLTRWAWNRPVTALVLAGLLPQFLGSALQIPYNALRVDLSPPQERFFPLVVVAYNLVVYPACLSWLGLRLARVVGVWRKLRRGERVDDAEVDAARRRALELPRDTAIVACVGWLPGMIVFPLALHLRSGDVTPDQCGHFAVSFALAGLIAVTYSFFGGLGVVVRTMYVRFWSDPRGFCERSTEELAAVPDRLRTLNILAGLIPLAGATMVVLVADREFTAESGGAFWFRFLAVSLILAGAAGYTAVGLFTRRFVQVSDACTGGTRESRPGVWKRK